MFLTEWDEEKYRDLLRREATEDGFAEGREKGLEEGREEGAKKERETFLARAARQVKEGLMDVDTAARVFGFSKDEIASIL